MGSRHAADTVGIEAIKVAEHVKTSVPVTDAIRTSKGYKFRIVQPLAKGIEVKTQFGMGVIVKLRGTEGVAGFSLVVQLDSWVLTRGQRPLLYCDADEVITLRESTGELKGNNTRSTQKSNNKTKLEKTISDAQSFVGHRTFSVADELEEAHEEDRSSRPKRTCRFIKSDKEGNVMIKEFHLALHYYLQENDESVMCRWQNDGREFVIYKDDLVATGLRDLMGIQQVTREKKRLRQWLYKEMYEHGFVRTR